MLRDVIFLNVLFVLYKYHFEFFKSDKIVCLQLTYLRTFKSLVYLEGGKLLTFSIPSTNTHAHIHTHRVYGGKFLDFFPYIIHKNENTSIYLLNVNLAFTNNYLLLFYRKQKCLKRFYLSILPILNKVLGMVMTYIIATKLN